MKASAVIHPSHKHTASVRYPTMRHFVTKMCTHVHISVTKWCNVGLVHCGVCEIVIFCRHILLYEIPWIRANWTSSILNPSQSTKSKIWQWHHTRPAFVTIQFCKASRIIFTTYAACTQTFDILHVINISLVVFIQMHVYPYICINFEVYF